MAPPPDRRGPPRERQDTDRRRMLDLRREGHFRFDLKEVLLTSSVPPEQMAAFGATILSKGARISTAAAKEYVTAKLEAAQLTKPERDAINTLIDRYSRWR